MMCFLHNTQIIKQNQGNTDASCLFRNMLRKKRRETKITTKYTKYSRCRVIPVMRLRLLAHEAHSLIHLHTGITFRHSFKSPSVTQTLPFSVDSMSRSQFVYFIPAIPLIGLIFQQISLIRVARRWSESPACPARPDPL